MVIQRIFVGLFLTVFVASGIVQASPETRLQLRKRLECESIMQTVADQGIAQGGDVKRHSPDMPAIGELSLAQEEPVAFVAANESKRARIDIVALFRSGKGLAGVTLESSDLENKNVSAEDLKGAPENGTVGTPESFMQGAIRALVHDALQSKDKTDVTVNENIALLSQKFPIAVVRDLIVEASMVDRTDVVDFLIKRAYSLEDDMPSASTYRAMAMGYRAAYFPQKYDKLRENMTAACFRAMFKDKKFVEAVDAFK